MVLKICKTNGFGFAIKFLIISRLFIGILTILELILWIFGRVYKLKFLKLYDPVMMGIKTHGLAELWNFNLILDYSKVIWTL